MTLPANPLSDPRRRRAEELASEGELAQNAGNHAEARARFAEAAFIEEEVAHDAPIAFPRPRTAIVIGAVSLWYRAKDYERAKRVADAFLAQAAGLTAEGRAALERLVDRCSREGGV